MLFGFEQSEIGEDLVDALVLFGDELYEVVTGQTVYVDVHRDDLNTVTIDGFTVAPTTGDIAGTAGSCTAADGP